MERNWEIEKRKKRKEWKRKGWDTMDLNENKN
jgi:hypothetical protein